MKKKKSLYVASVVLCVVLMCANLFLVGWEIASETKGEGRTDGVLDSSPGTRAPDEETASPLKFSDGKFKIAYICDIQDVYPMNRTTKAFIQETLRREKPDLVILGGDNTIAEKEDKDKAVAELTDLFVSAKTYFTLVFGNHDHEQEVCDDDMLTLYQKYGGEYCLAYDAHPELTGTASHNLTVAASDSDKAVYNLWMMDSNEYDGGGDGAVNVDQVAWYEKRCDELAVQNGGTVLPALEFQYIVEHCVMDKIFVRAPFFAGNIGRKTSDATYWLWLKKNAEYEGFVNELICCGYYDHGFHDAMLRKGDVKACFSGHDHICNYICEVDGIRYINTSAATFCCYNEDYLVGCRIIELDESNLETFSTRTVFVTDYAKEDNSPLNLYGDMTQEFAKKMERKRNLYGSIPMFH